MPDEKKIPELGLAEFVSTLIRETFDAILTAQEEQSEKIALISDIAGRSPEEVAAGFISPDEIEAGLQRLFPAPDEPFCTLYEGAPYRPEPNEHPPVFVACGYGMQKNADYAGGVITEKGYQAVVRQVSLLLASEKLQQIRNMVRNGVPKIQVDRGKILARVSFSVRETTEAGDDPVTAGSAIPSAKLPSTFLQKIDVLGGKPLKSLKLPAARMMVKQATESGAASSNSTNIYGEVEIHFRSVQ